MKGIALFALVSVAPMIATAPPAFELPAPSGPSAVATTQWWVTDESRRESFAASSESRQVKVVAWYPSAGRGRGERAPYLREGAAESQTFATLVRAPGAFEAVASVATHAGVDDAPAPKPAKHPVLLFSHGYTGIASAHTALLQDLASHGYVVLSIVHPYEAAAATLGDGRVVSLLADNGALRQAIRDVFDEWKVEDDVMAAVTRASDEETRRRLMREYLSGLRNTHIALRRWVDDTKLVLDRLNALSPSTAAGRLAASVDRERVGVFGHSMGGVTAGQFCVEDRRCRAALNLDGIPQYGTMIDAQLRRPFLMVYSARPGRSGASDVIYRNAASPYYRVDVRDTLHLDFSDLVFWGGPLRERGRLGKLTPARAHEITREIVRQYFDRELLGRRSPLLEGKDVPGEITVVRH
jgi:predicted dienelactone hydrolase